MKILYVEDNAVNLSLIARIAKMNQHELVSFEEAEQALSWLEKPENNVDLILLDIQLAGEMDGITFAKTLRGKGETHPIIAITAYAMMGDKERILAAGCNEYLPKPLPIAEFLTLLAKYDPATRVVAQPEVETKPVDDAVTRAIENTTKETKPKPPAELKAYLEAHPKTEPRPAVPAESTPQPAIKPADAPIKTENMPPTEPKPVVVVKSENGITPPEVRVEDKKP
jgi:CheY-like chemotaxis protein